MTGELLSLVDKWRAEAMSAVPPVYLRSGLGEKYLRGDNEAAGKDGCADELDEVIARINQDEVLNRYDARIAALESALCEIWKVWQEPTTGKAKREILDKHWPTIEAIPARNQNGA